MVENLISVQPLRATWRGMTGRYKIDTEGWESRLLPEYCKVILTGKSRPVNKPVKAKAQWTSTACA